MHLEALEYVSKWATDKPVAVLDIGGRDVNGTCRDFFPKAIRYYVVDMIDAWDVDLVTDAADWEPDGEYDVVLSTEVFEHTARWPEICQTAFKALKPGGMFIITCAGPQRAPHSGLDGEAVRAGEFYANVTPGALLAELCGCGFHPVEVEEQGLDVRGVAWR